MTDKYQKDSQAASFIKHKEVLVREMPKPQCFL